MCFRVVFLFLALSFGTGSAFCSDLVLSCETVSRVGKNTLISIRAFLTDQGAPWRVKVLGTHSRAIKTYRKQPELAWFDEGDEMAKSFVRYDITDDMEDSGTRYYLDLPKQFSLARGEAFQAALDAYVTRGRSEWYRLLLSCRID
ncbi:MAG: hypothetical protein A2X94_02850 [Bdellovibrionales bacterium GWB1_55_8]|nr:MAG: hypothetical protein A2X94_02850 [Bdellovibrionales bacterium GWB1_55_8]